MSLLWKALLLLRTIAFRLGSVGATAPSEQLARCKIQPMHSHPPIVRAER